jgi:hypothetical protein
VKSCSSTWLRTWGRYEPLVGYTILESCGVVVDLVTHRLIARKYYDLKRSCAA